MPRSLTAQEQTTLGILTSAKVLSCTKRVSQDESPTDSLVARVGLLRTPEEFVEQAVKMKHPFDDSWLLEDDVKKNIFNVLTKGPQQIHATRCETLAYYEDRAVALQAAEDALHRSLPADRARVLEGKRLLLFRGMCGDAGVEEAKDLLELQLLGTPLTGKSAPTKLYAEDELEPAISDEQLMKSSKWSRPMVMSKTGDRDQHPSASDVWDVTTQEVERGWLAGPFTEEEMPSKHGPLFVASPRFGVVQSDKLRPIDDMSVSLVNAAFSPSYTSLTSRGWTV